MCGINLTFGKNKIELMNAALSHRGIRSKYQQLTVTNDLYMGHVRLPIQGLSPEFDCPYEYKDLTIGFVGEIFNYKQINPEAKSDIEVLAKQLTEKGTNAFPDFDGFWSVIVYQHEFRQIHVFTDSLAKKPLYYRMDGNFGISSEISALVHLGEVTPDEIYFSAVAKWGYCPENRTPFKEIIKFPPFSHWVFSESGQVISAATYDVLKPNPSVNLCDALRVAVENRMVSDVPISLLMSGGLDSTIIYYLMRDLTDRINIFHIENDEAQYLKYIDFRPFDIVTTLSIDTKYDLEDILWFNDGPVDLGSVIPQYQLSKAIRDQGFDVCLSGDGADELFGGYKRSREYDSQWSDIFHELVFYHLPRLDKMMMANTVELRSPFLARPVIEAALTLPYHDRVNKAVLKETFRDTIPDEILYREKKPLRFKKSQDWTNELIKSFRELCWR